MTRESPVTSPALSRRSDLQSIPNGHENALQHRILELKKQQQLQQQILLQQFQVQQQQLAQQHEEQLRHHLKELWEQQKEQQAREQERLESLKKKEKHEQSAVASSEVKQKLQGFILGKKQREAAAAANGTVPGQGFRSWSVLHNAGSDSQSKQVVTVTGSGSVVPPYHLNPLLKNFDDDFPLRKTASEPNLLKVRLKQRVIERRSSPIARRRDRHPKRKSQLAIEPNSNPDSGPNSPPVTVTSQMSPPAGHNMPIQEEGKSPYNPATAGSMTDLSALYQSPSMPNISLGRPPTSSSQSDNRLAPVSEAEVRAAFTARSEPP